MQANQLLVQQEQETRYQKNRAQQILQMVQEKDQAQRDKEVGLYRFLLIYAKLKAT